MLQSARCGLLFVFLVSSCPLVVLSFELRGGKEANTLEADARGTPTGIPVWVWWDYANEPNPVVQSCSASWRVHAPAPQFELRLVNASNIHKWLPDLPEEFDRLPYVAAVSDFARAGLLAKYGGAYLDTDVLLLKSLSIITDHLRQADFVAYTNDEQNCKKGQFSSNIIAGKPGNSLSVAWYEEAARQLKQSCKLPEKEDISPQQGVCCYSPDGAKRKQCHINWGGVGERIAHPLFKRMLDAKSHFQMYCFDEKLNEGFSPTGSDDYVKLLGEDFPMTTSAPCQTDGHDLVCVGKRNRYNLFDRVALHLFQSNWSPADHSMDLVNGHYVISRLIRKSLNK